jgi:hypothetical protein
MTRRERKTRSEPKTRRGRTLRRWDRSAAAKPRGERGRVARLAFDGGRISAPGLQRPGGGAGPRTARASGGKRPLGQRPVAQAIEMVNRFAVVIMPPPVHRRCRSQKAMHTLRRLEESILGSLPAAAQLVTRRYRALTYVRTRPAWTKSKARWSTTRHDSAALIFDELEYEPFTENRRVPSGKIKIARPRPPATLSQPQFTRNSR